MFSTIYMPRLSQDQMHFFVSPEVIFQGCLSESILCFLTSTDKTVLENVYSCISAIKFYTLEFMFINNAVFVL